MLELPDSIFSLPSPNFQPLYNSLHILFIPAWFETPAHPTSGKAVKDLAFALAQHGLNKLNGHKIHLLFQSSDPLPEVQPLSSSVDLFHDQCASRGKLYPWWNVRALKSFNEAIDRYITVHGLPDLIHIHSYPVLPYAVQAFKKRNIPFIYTEHSSKVGLDRLSWIERKLVRRYAAYSRGSFAVSRHLAFRLQRVIGKKVSVIPNTIDFNLFTPDDTRTPGQWIMINLLNKNKQVDLGIKAFDLYASQVNHATLHIIGDGPERTSLEKLIASLESKDRIKRYGECGADAWLPILKASVGMLVLSKFETFGVAALEALACEVPVIALNNQGIQEVTEHIGLKLLPVHANAQDIAKRMAEIKGFDISWKSTREILTTRFGYASVAAQYVQVFQNILSNNT